MKYKINDICYLGCDSAKIRTAQPELNEEVFKHLHKFITERYKIHILKDVQGLSKPWTDDSILQNFRFTNVRREHDKETKWVIENICSISEDKMSWASKICNLILFRMFNKSETCKNFMPLNFDDGLDWNKLYDYFNSVPKGYVFFTNAFITGGMKMSCCRELDYTSHYTDKLNGVRPEFAVVRYVETLYNNEEFIASLGNCVTAKQFYDVLSNTPALGPFLSYQIFVDYTYCDECLWSENEFVVAGPGCKRGLNLLFKDYDGMTHEESLFWLRDNWESLCYYFSFPWDADEIFCDLPKEDRYMNVMSLENCFCELSKYVKTIRGEGRPRNTYKGA